MFLSNLTGHNYWIISFSGLSLFELEYSAGYIKQLKHFQVIKYEKAN